MKESPFYQTELEKVFRHDIATDIVERKFRGGRWEVVKARPRKDGYSRVIFNGRTILIHRLIYTLVYGDIPKGMEVDHINGNPENNKLSNLQILSPRDNKAKSRKGINPNFDKSRGKYRVQATAKFDGKQHHFHFKEFKDKTDAKLLCDAYNALFTYGKPLYKAKLGTYDEWLEYMEAFKNQYLNNQYSKR